MAIDVQYGDGFTLTTTDGAYFTVSPGAANAGMTSDGTDTTSTIFQLLTYFGGNTGGTVTYGAQMSMQLPENQLWVTLNPAYPFGTTYPYDPLPLPLPPFTPNTSAMPYVRNNAPQPLGWETLYFVPVSGNSGDPISYGQEVYVATTNHIGLTSYLQLDTTSQTALTIPTVFGEDTVPDGATPLIITSASFTPYSQASNTNPPFNNDDQFLLQCGPPNAPTSLHFNAAPSANNAGYLIDLTGTSTVFRSISATNYTDTSQQVYGTPVFFGPSYSQAPFTMNPAPGRIRSNAGGPGTWEIMYFISVNGKNGDLMYYGDQIYVARNGLISGDFVTEYMTVDMTEPTMAMITTTTDFYAATPLTLYQIVG